MRKNKFLKVKIVLLELERIFIEFKGIEDIEVKIKREIKELFFKPIIVITDDMDRLEKKEMKKIRPIKKNWYN